MLYGVGVRWDVDIFKLWHITARAQSSNIEVNGFTYYGNTFLLIYSKRLFNTLKSMQFISSVKVFDDYIPRSMWQPQSESENIFYKFCFFNDILIQNTISKNINDNGTYKINADNFVLEIKRFSVHST